MIDFGFPVGPITLLDEVGIDVGAKVGDVMLEAFGERMAPPRGAGEALVDDGRLGRKNGRGFYTYDGQAKKARRRRRSTRSCPAARAAQPIAAEEIQERLRARRW
ncbi:MAG: 3-hydroxyacyl-CoA dehydrogenase family protein [Candidatus Moduliflexus flocculans]|nr:3-hydroxyacyl-CoA dehydrogenase family protein [Candidatus Moduliflexus flocculans]